MELNVWDDLFLRIDRIREKILGKKQYDERFLSEIEFTTKLCLHKGRQNWKRLVRKALERSERGIEDGENLERITREVEDILSPIGQEAKKYCLNYVAHAHIDMNWLWGWPDTVDSCYRTFSTVVELMDEFPEFCFSESQIATYEIVRRYSPELFEKIKQKIKGGQWEVIANTWVEADKNMSSGESQLRQLLYAKKYLREVLDLDEREIKIDWEPDTFGHSITTPKILNQVGIKYYFLRRPGSNMQPDICQGMPGQRPILFWWTGQDDSKVLVWNNDRFAFGQHVNKVDMGAIFLLEEQTGLKQFMVVYGIGDHGGGPSREDIKKIREMNNWPIFPHTRFSTAEHYFELAEEEAEDLPVVSEELNFVWRGGYSSQSKIKYSNRRMENQLSVCESFASIADIYTDFDYPIKELEQSWEKALFNQFHDILPGTCIKEASEHAQGNFQEVEARTSIIIKRSLKKIVSNINNADGNRGIPVIVFNPASYERTDKVEFVLYGVSGDKELVIRDREGNVYPVQIVETLASLKKKVEKEGSFYGQEGNYLLVDIPNPPMLRFDIEHGHQFAKVVFTAKKVPSFGYKTFWIDEVSELPERLKAEGVKVGETRSGAWMENDFLKVEIDARSCSLISVLDKIKNRELVPKDKKFGMFVFELEEPHKMSAWARGRLKEEFSLDWGGTLEVVERGPARALIRCHNSIRNSHFDLDIALYKDLPELEFTLNLDWREAGSEESGVPVLKVCFPISLDDPKYIYEVPFGNIQRNPDGKEVPAQRWGSIVEKDSSIGITITNSHTYSYSGYDNGIALTLLRSSYEPDPLPEMGRHRIKYSVCLSHDWGPAQATRFGLNFNAPLIPFRAQKEGGDWPPELSFLSVKPANVLVTAFKKAEDANGTILRLIETSGKNCVVTIESERKIDEAYEIDPIERNSSKKRIAFSEDTLLKVEMDRYEIKSILLTFR